MASGKKFDFYLIGISGGSASGKSHLIERIRSMFDQKSICLVSQDDYYKPTDLQYRDKEGIINFDLPSAIDETRMLNDLIAISQGNKIEIEEYTFEDVSKIPVKKEIYPAPIVMVEGLFIFNYKKIADLLDYKVFIEADEEVRLRRRLKRDIVERKIPEDKIRYQWYRHVRPAYDSFVRPFSSEANMIIKNDNNTLFEEGFNNFASHLKKVSGNVDI